MNTDGVLEQASILRYAIEAKQSMDAREGRLKREDKYVGNACIPMERDDDEAVAKCQAQMK